MDCIQNGRIIRLQMIRDLTDRANNLGNKWKMFQSKELQQIIKIRVFLNWSFVLISANWEMNFKNFDINFVQIQLIVNVTQIIYSISSQENSSLISLGFSSHFS